MGAIGFTLELEPRHPNQGDTDPNGLEELFYEIVEMIHHYLGETFKREAELSLLDDLDEVVECDCDELEELRLTFLFHDHWYLGSEVAYHWYQHALCSQTVMDELQSKLHTFDLNQLPLEWKLEDLIAPQSEGLLFVPKEEDDMLAVSSEGKVVEEDEEGSLVEIEVEDYVGTEVEMGRIQKAIATKQCQCQLCQFARGEDDDY